MEIYDIQNTKTTLENNLRQKTDQISSLYGCPVILLGRDLELWLLGIIVGTLFTILAVLY